MLDEIPTLLRRLDMAERSQSDLEGSLTRLAGDVDELRRPLDELRTDRAVRKVRDENLNERLGRIEASITKVHNLGWWVLGAFGMSLIALVANFIFRGGLNAL